MVRIFFFLKTRGQVTQCVQEETQIKKSWVQRSCLYSTSRDDGQSSFVGLWLDQDGGQAFENPSEKHHCSELLSPKLFPGS